MQRAKVIRSLGMHIARSSHGTSFSFATWLNRLKRVSKGSARVIALFLSFFCRSLSLSFYRHCSRHHHRCHRRHRVTQGDHRAKLAQADSHESR